MTDNLTAIRERHFEDRSHPSNKPMGECREDEQPWPCDAALLLAALDALRPPEGTRLILATDQLLDHLVTRSEDGSRVTHEWGEADEHGWYTPTFTEHHDDNLALDDSLDAAWAAAEAALPEGFQFYQLELSEKLRWEASASRRLPEGKHGTFSPHWDVRSAHGDTPPAALRALAARLNEETTDG